MKAVYTTGRLFKLFISSLVEDGFIPEWNHEDGCTDVLIEAELLMPGNVALIDDDAMITMDGNITLRPGQGSRKIQKLYREWAHRSRGRESSSPFVPGSIEEALVAIANTEASILARTSQSAMEGDISARKAVIYRIEGITAISRMPGVELSDAARAALERVATMGQNALRGLTLVEKKDE